MGKFFSSVFVVASIVFLAVGCNRNDNMGNGMPGDRGPEVPVKVEVGTSYRLEGDMNQIDVFLFEGSKDSPNKNFTLSYQVKAGSIEFDQENGSGTVSFNAFPTKEGNECDIVFLANCPQEVTQNMKGATGTSKEVFLKALEASIPQESAFWVAEMPLCGQLTNIVISDDGTLLSEEKESQTSVVMYRALARIDLSNQDPAHFTLKGVRVHNAMGNFRLVPDEFLGNTTELPDPRTPSLPETPYIFNRWYNNEDGSTEIAGKFYHAEYSNDGKENEQLSFLLLKGDYTPDGGEKMENRYYRINFQKNGDILDIMRNSLYIIRINNVIGPGYPTEEDALKGVPVNINAAIEQQKDYSLPNFQNGGQYTLTVSNCMVETGKSLSWQSIGIETSEPDGWKIYTKGDKPTLESNESSEVLPDWIHLSTTEPQEGNTGGMDPAEISGPAGELKNLYIITDAISESLPESAKFRTGAFYVQSGNLIKKITVTQRDQDLASMTVSPSPLEFGKEPSAPKEVTISLEPSTVKYTVTVTELDGGTIEWAQDNGPTQTIGESKNGVAVMRLKPVANESGKERKSTLSIVAKGPEGTGLQSRAMLEVIQTTTSNILTAEPLVLTSAAQQAKLSVSSDLPWKMIDCTDDQTYGPVITGVLNRTEFPSGNSEYPFKVTENKTWKNRYISFVAGPASRDEDLGATIPEIRQEYPQPYIRLKNKNGENLQLILLDNEQGAAVSEPITVESNSPWKYPYGDSQQKDPLSGIGLEIADGEVINEDNKATPAAKTEFNETLVFQPFGHPVQGGGHWYDGVAIPSAGDKMTYTLVFGTTLQKADITREDRPSEDLPEPTNAKAELEIQRVVPSLWKFSGMQIVGGSSLDEGAEVIMNSKPFEVAVSAYSNDSWTVSAQVATNVISEGNCQKAPYTLGKTEISIPANPTWSFDGSKHYREIVITAKGSEFGETRTAERTLKQSGYYLTSMTADSLAWPGVPDTKQVSVKASGEFDRIPLYLFELDKFGNRTDILAWTGEHYFDGENMTDQTGELLVDIPFRLKWGGSKVGLYYKLPTTGYKLLWKGWQPGYNMLISKGPDFPDEVPAIGAETSIELSGTWPEIYAKISGEYYSDTKNYAFKAGNGKEQKKITVQATQAWDTDKGGRNRKITIYADRTCTEAVDSIDFLQGTYSFKNYAWKDARKPEVYPDGGTVEFKATGIWPSLPVKCTFLSEGNQQPYPEDQFTYIQANLSEKPIEAESSVEIPALPASVWDGYNNYGPTVEGQMQIYRTGGRMELGKLGYTQQTYHLTPTLEPQGVLPAYGGTLQLKLEGVWPKLKYKITDNMFQLPYQGEIPAGNSREAAVVINIPVYKTYNYFEEERLLTVFCEESGYEKEFTFYQERGKGMDFIPQETYILSGLPEVIVDDELQFLTEEEVKSNTIREVWDLADRRCRERGMKLLTDEFEIAIYAMSSGKPKIERCKIQMSGILGPGWISLGKDTYVTDLNNPDGRKTEFAELSWNNWRLDGKVDLRYDPANPSYPMAPFYKLRKGYTASDGSWKWVSDDFVYFSAIKREYYGDGLQDGYPEDCYRPWMMLGCEDPIADTGPYNMDKAGLNAFVFRCVLEKKYLPAD